MHLETNRVTGVQAKGLLATRSPERVALERAASELHAVETWDDLRKAVRPAERRRHGVGSGAASWCTRATP